MSKKPYKAELVLSRLFELYPDVFRAEQPPPLKVGIHKDLIAMIETLGEPFSKRSIFGAMLFYTQRPEYQRAVKAGCERIDLNGIVTGTVSEADAVAAQKKLARLLENLSQGQEPKQPAPKVKPEPKLKPKQKTKLKSVSKTSNSNSGTVKNVQKVRQQGKDGGVAVVIKKKRRLTNQ